jgi:hypothetical protein
MNRKSITVFAVKLVAACGLFACAAAASADNRVNWSITLGTPAPPVVYYAPAPVYVQPPPAYVQPHPTYLQPQPVYVAPPIVPYGQVYYYQAPRHHHRHHRHGHFRHHRD